MSDFKAKMHRNRFQLGLRPRYLDTAVGAYSAPQIAWNKGDLLLTEGNRCREGGTVERKGGSFKAKMHQNQFQMRLRPRYRRGSLQRSPDRLAGIKGTYFYRKGKDVGKGKERK